MSLGFVWLCLALLWFVFLCFALLCFEIARRLWFSSLWALHTLLCIALLCLTVFVFAPLCFKLTIFVVQAPVPVDLCFALLCFRLAFRFCFSSPGSSRDLCFALDLPKGFLFQAPVPQWIFALLCSRLAKRCFLFSPGSSGSGEPGSGTRPGKP